MRDSLPHSTFGYAIVGCGWVADAHAWGVRSLADEGVQLVAVADSDRARADRLATRFGDATPYVDYHRLLERDDVQALSICLPDFLHEEAAIAAAACGKHILCEKPLAVDLESADAMVEAAEHRAVNLGVVMNHRYAPDNIRVRAALRAGALGRLVIGDVLHSSSLTGDPDNSSPWRGRQGRAAGGVLSTQAIHFLDLLLWFAGRVTSVQAYADTLLRSEQDYEDTAALSLRFESGALATVVTTNASPITDDFTGTRVEIQGTDGYISLEGDLVRTWECQDGRERPQVELPPPPPGSEEVVFGVGHVHQVMDFVRAARRGSPAPVPGKDGRHLMAVLAAAYASADEGREMEVVEHHDAYSRTAADPESLLYGRQTLFRTGAGTGNHSSSREGNA